MICGCFFGLFADVFEFFHTQDIEKEARKQVDEAIAKAKVRIMTEHL